MTRFNRRSPFLSSTARATVIAGGDPDAGSCCDDGTAGRFGFPRRARVRLRAQELYRLRGVRPGSALEDWLRAEEQIREAEEQAVDEASEDSFPASDPPAH